MRRITMIDFGHQVIITRFRTIRILVYSSAKIQRKLLADPKTVGAIERFYGVTTARELVVNAYTIGSRSS
jgi:hypothetical protein